VTADKRALRAAVLARRDALDPAARATASDAISARLLALPSLARAHTVAAYLSFGSELDTAAFVRAVIASGRRLILPRAERASRALTMHAVTDLDGALLPGPFGIREPDPARCPAVAPDQIDFVLVPGVAFTPRCERLGYGGGFYDRFLPRCTRAPALVAAAFALQVVETLPLEPTDLPVDRVITESGEFAREP